MFYIFVADLKTKLGELGIPTETITGYVDQFTTTLVDASTSDLLTNGLSFDSLTTAFDPCLDVLNTAKSMVYIPKLSEIVGFDFTEFFVNIISLLNDGSTCYVQYVALNSEDGAVDATTVMYLGK